MGYSKLLLQVARQLCKSDWITWFLPPWCSRTTPGCNLNVSLTPAVGTWNLSTGFSRITELIISGCWWPHSTASQKKTTWDSSVLKPLYKGQRSWQGGHAIPETINTLPYDSSHGLATTHIDTCLICRRWQDLGWEGGQGQQTGWETGICYNVCQYRLWGAMII